MLKKNANPIDKNELFAHTPIPKALRVMAVPTIKEPPSPRNILVRTPNTL